MSVSKAVRMALKKAGKQNADLAQLWGYTLNATSNKFQWERWTGKELSEVAEMTGGQLAFVYPDGTQITIPQEDTKRDAKAAAQRKNETAPGEHPATASGGNIAGREVTRNKRAVRGTVAPIEGADKPKAKKAKAPAAAAKKKAPAKPKKAKAPAVMEEQISFFE